MQISHGQGSYAPVTSAELYAPSLNGHLHVVHLAAVALHPFLATPFLLHYTYEVCDTSVSTFL